MNLQRTYTDKFYNIKTFFYTLPNGLKFVFTKHHYSSEYILHLNFKAGTYFEKIFKVPNGTAHLLEHLMEGKPNSFLKTFAELDDFKRGNRERARIYSNAFTGRRLLGFNSSANKQAIERMCTLLLRKVTDPTFAIDHFLESEKNIVLGEIDREQADKDNADLVYDQTFLKEYADDFLLKVLGTKETITSITKEHVLLFFKTLIRSDNGVLSIKGPVLTQKIKLFVKELDAVLAKDKIHSSIPAYPDRGINGEFKYKYFKSKQTQGIFMSYSVVHNLLRKMDHKQDRKNILIDRFTGWSLNEFLREEKKLVYSVSNVNASTPIHANLRGFNTIVSKENFPIVLEHIYNFIFEDGWKSYLFSERGQTWLNDQVSGYIFKTDSGIDSDYAESNGIDFLLNEFLSYDYEIAKKEMYAMKIEDIAESFEFRYLQSKPKVWLSSNFKQSEIMPIFKESKLFKRLSAK